MSSWIVWEIENRKIELVEEWGGIENREFELVGLVQSQFNLQLYCFFFVSSGSSASYRTISEGL